MQRTKASASSRFPYSSIVQADTHETIVGRNANGTNLGVHLELAHKPARFRAVQLDPARGRGENNELLIVAELDARNREVIPFLVRGHGPVIEHALIPGNNTTVERR
jgi:hypothetical protein